MDCAYCARCATVHTVNTVHTVHTVYTVYIVHTVCTVCTVHSVQLKKIQFTSNQWRTKEFCSGGLQQIQLRTEDRENGDLGAVAP